jgi:hypothetical protein
MGRGSVCLSFLLALLLIALPSAQAQDDSDGDGVADVDDAFPNHPDAWNDTDEDGYTDQPGTNISDDCPNTYGLSKKYMFGCIDTDRDWVPDVLDDDIDGDGITNNQELAASNALIKYDIFNPDSVPPDSDFDTIPDVIDDDDDNDGWLDKTELERGSDPFDESSTPFNLYGGNTGWFYLQGEGLTTEYSEEGFEISLSWLLSALTSELIIPIALIPIYAAIWTHRSRNFRRLDKGLGTISSVTELREIEEEFENLMRGRRLHTHHGVILRNTIERREDELDQDWFKSYGRGDSEE